MAALFLSGAAGLINQVVWQRALKVFLGGSETISSMVVVFVFLGGLGWGSFWVSRRLKTAEQPWNWLGRIELLLAVVNCLICWVLSLDVAESVYWFQRTALALGVPLQMIYATGAILILTLPCFLMGMTLPVAAESLQRELREKSSRRVNQLYVLNTSGAVLGATAGVGILLPNFGQHSTLVMAAGLNAAAGVVILLLSGRDVAGLPLQQSECCESDPVSGYGQAGFLIMTFGLGLSALWYEMLLIRTLVLRYQPLPLTFSAVLAGYLLFWSAGAAASSAKRVAPRLKTATFGCILSLVGSIFCFIIDTNAQPLDSIGGVLRLVLTRPLYFLPCFFFGLLFGLTLERSIRLWGRDVGRFSGWNTLGSCCGILLGTFVGYEMNLLAMMFPLWLFLLALSTIESQIERLFAAGRRAGRVPMPRVPWLQNIPGMMFAGLAVVAMCLGLLTRHRQNADGSAHFFGRDGVISLDSERNLIWDGLRHSTLSQNNDHIGTYNWAVAVDPLLAHPTGQIEEALVIGVGGGITLGTLVKHEPIRLVEAYDINHTLKPVLERFPEGTLHVAAHSKARLIWQDGRSGLALNPKQYDLITQQPLYLKQAGSGILLSKEYFRLVAKRLKPDGVFCVYSNGTPQQALAVRQTAAEVFPYRLVLHNGYLLVLSSSPLDFSQTRLDALLNQEGELLREIRAYRDRIGWELWLKYTKTAELPLADSQVVITDDFPIVEYPAHLAALLKRTGFAGLLPQPGF
jgi:spermidine synthase